MLMALLRQAGSCFTVSVLMLATVADRVCAQTESVSPSENKAGMGARKLLELSRLVRLYPTQKRPSTYWSAAKTPVPSAKQLFDDAYKKEAANQTSEAISLYKQAVKADPELLAAYYNLGLCQESQEQYGQAVEAFKKCVELSPHAYRAIKHLAFDYSKLHDFEHAQVYIEHYLTMAPPTEL